MENTETVVVDIEKIKQASPDIVSWKEYQIKEQQETPKRLEDAAKYLATMISISLTVFLSIFGKGGTAKPDGVVFIVLLVLWGFSLLFSFLVIFPRTYEYSSHSVQSFQKVHKQIVKRKHLLLMLSVACYFSALISLGVMFFL